jgi:hypothetical protein
VSTVHVVRVPRETLTSGLHLKEKKTVAVVHPHQSPLLLTNPFRFLLPHITLVLFLFFCIHVQMVLVLGEALLSHTPLAVWARVHNLPHTHTHTQREREINTEINTESRLVCKPRPFLHTSCFVFSVLRLSFSPSSKYTKEKNRSCFFFFVRGLFVCLFVSFAVTPVRAWSSPV